MSPEEYRALRKSLGWSQARLAEALGVHRVTVADRERGAVKITSEAEHAIRRVVEQARSPTSETEPEEER